MTNVPLFVNGEGMSGGQVHYSIDGHPFLNREESQPGAEPPLSWLRQG